MLAWTCSLTRFTSTFSTSPALSDPPWEKSKRRWSGATSEPACITWVPRVSPEGRVEQVRPRVVELEPSAPGRLDGHGHLFVLPQPPLADADAVDDQMAAAVVGVLDGPLPLAPHDGAGIAHLAARLGIGWRAVEDHLDNPALPRLGEPPSLADQGQDPRGRRRAGCSRGTRAWRSAPSSGGSSRPCRRPRQRPRRTRRPPARARAAPPSRPRTAAAPPAAPTSRRPGRPPGPGRSGSRGCGRRKRNFPSATFRGSFAWPSRYSRNLTVPRPSVSLKRSSSCFTASATRPRASTISGYAPPRISTTVGVTSQRKGRLRPSIRPWRMARRMMRRST